MAAKGNAKIAEYGKKTQFKKGHAGMGGRPRRVLPKPEELYDTNGNVLNAEALVQETAEFLLFATPEQQKAVANDPTMPHYVSGKIKVAHSGPKGFIAVMKEAEYRVAGKPTQHTDVTSNGETLTQFLVTDKEKDILDKLSK